MLSAYHRHLVLHTLLALLTAVLLLLVFPRFDLHLLAPVALTPLLIVVARTKQAWLRFAYGWAAGIFYWFFLCTWIQYVLEVHGGMGAFGGWGAFVLFCLLKALHMAVFGVLAGPLLEMRWSVLTVPALWAGLERTHGTFGFSWLDLGNAAINMGVPLRVVPYLGVYGASFVFAMMATAVTLVVTRRKRLELLPLALLLCLFLLPEVPQNVPAPDRAVVVQPNIDPETQWTGLAQWKSEQELARLSNALPAPLVIWPELPAPFYYYSDPDLHAIATAIARKHGSFLFETVAFNSKSEPLNSAVLVDSNGLEAGRYDQIDLVPFGEYIPPMFSWVNRITKETSDFVPGHDVKVFPAEGHRVGVFICYESTAPDLVRQFAAKGADVLVNLSNDGYFAHSQAREQHLLIARMRAVENRRYLIRATNDGITAVIDPAGRIVRELPRYREVAAQVAYGGVNSTTFYTTHGDWFAWFCLAVGVLLSTAKMVAGRRAKRGASKGPLRVRTAGHSSPGLSAHQDH